MANGARRELARPSTRHTSTVHVHTHRNMHILCPLSPSTNHIHWLQTDTEQRTVLSQTPLPAWNYYITYIWFVTIQQDMRFKGMQGRLAKPWMYMWSRSYPREAIENTFPFFQKLPVESVSGLGGVSRLQKSKTSCTAQGQTMQLMKRALLITSSSLWLVKRLKGTPIQPPCFILTRLCLCLLSVMMWRLFTRREYFKFAFIFSSNWVWLTSLIICSCLPQHSS